MPRNNPKINIYSQPVEGQDIVYQSGWFDYRDLQTIISKGSLLTGTNVQTWFEQEDLPGNKTKFIYHLKGYVDFQWEQIMPKTKEQSYFDKMFEKLRKDLKEDIKKSEDNIKAYVDEKVSESETNIKVYVDNKVSESETNIKVYVDEKVSKSETNIKEYVDEKVSKSETNIKVYIKEQIDNHVRDYH